MSSETPRAGAGGVSSLRAMFESQNPTPESSDRGRTPSGSSNDDSARKLSRIRSSFVTVEPSAAALAKTTADAPPEAIIANLDRREMFSLDKHEDAPAIEEMQRTITRESEKRKNSQDVVDIVPEVAIETGPAGFGTPLLVAQPDKKLECIKNNTPTLAGGKTSRKASPAPSKGKTLKADALPPTEVLQNLANNLNKTPSQPKTNGKLAAAQPAPTSNPEPLASGPIVSVTAAAEPTTPSPAAKGGKVTPSNVITSTGDLQTSPGGVSPTVARHALIIPELEKEGQEFKLSTAREPASSVAAKRRAAPTSTKKPVASALTATTTRSPRPSRSTPNFRSGTAGPSNIPSGRKPPAVPVIPKTSSTARERVVSNRTSDTSTISGIGFHKPRPKSPTRPLNLPSHLIAPTASSAAKKHGEQPAQSVRPTGTRESSRRPSMMSERGTRPTPASLKPPMPVRHQPLKSSVGPPPKKRELAPATKRDNRTPDDSFLARMMRPTASSSSKNREGKEPEPQHKHPKAAGQQQPRPKAVAADVPPSAPALTSTAPAIDEPEPVTSHDGAESNVDMFTAPASTDAAPAVDEPEPATSLGGADGDVDTSATAPTSSTEAAPASTDAAPVVDESETVTTPIGVEDNAEEPVASES